ncbi:uncharacterized protein PGTG_02112 [Puccinia graminis f. sp. tritici CRL 75-36-700-3]|uniref:NEDD8-activating enzyme E1 regulatory subunit n=1 Tax=Puccinia graminis f. sp. tritici (strain CRL 75-36-700-3 / race SCCL) TaxID=418459 RepID=E3JX76_PUCGT|nr:uncharacterized protein PGTG_02112 [Puccinia graminis f. sp. tritici CRL 75-36-700-3]EFP76651.2 hypothetical protein PGTG_02112 [Puccinia graminis f. sp. tritici CRL 75-36-700-3]
MSAQIAKNLVLSGIKTVEIYDTKVVRQSDIGNHFFLDQSSLGKNQSKECSRLLDKISPTKYGPVNYEDDDMLGEEYYDGFDDLHGFWEWNTHICARLIARDERFTSQYCWDFHVPTISVQTCGLAARIEVHIREHNMIPSHPASPANLRLDCPFLALSEYVDSFEMDKISNHEHAHIPAVVIIIRFLQIVKSKHGGNLPKDSAQREELKQMILAEKRNADEDNFDEAVSMIWNACQPTKVPEHVEELFKNPHCDKIPWHDGRFWSLVKILRKFVKMNPSRQLPLSGVLPDMKSDTKNYVKLQSIYRQQALKDLETFKKIMKGTEESTGEESGEDEAGKEEKEEEEEGHAEYCTDMGHHTDGPDFDVSSEMLETFVKNSAHIRMIRGAEYGTTPKDWVAKFEKECKPGNEEYVVTWYLAFEAMSVYRSENEGEYPGMRKGQEDEDFATLSKIALDRLTGSKLHHETEKKLPEKLEKVLKEMVRSAGCELPHISSIVGGLVSQEVIKHLTRQYVPMNGICIFDGYRSTTGVLEF